ncbi:MAG TPA: cation:proton antiporter [Gammaproteobacteria bacterium]|nr:cation:proton antiporter [Gammaproteobacteria bacterium]
MPESTEHLSLVPDLVSGIMWLMLFAALTAMVGSKLRRLPFTIALVLVGIGLARLAELTPLLEMLTSFQLTPELVLFVFIPTLIYESAHGLEASELQRNLMPVLVLAVPGLLLSTAIIGGIFFYLTSFSLVISLLLGAILSATDPVAVIAIFKQLGVPERLTVLVEGESLFNDATSLVLAGLLIAIAISGDVSLGTLLTGGVDFFKVFFGGVLVGWIFALLICQLLGMVEANPPVEITLTTILAYLSFIIAEEIFHVSGIMAVVAAGLTVSGYGRSKITPSTKEYIENFWEYAAWLANALIFIMVGMSVDFATAYRGCWKMFRLL